MDQRFSDLLRDAFSETSVPSFPEGYLDFENLDFDEKHENISGENTSTTDNRVLQQEATGQAAVMDENIHETLCDKDDFQAGGVTNVDKAQEECSTSSEGEDDDEEEQKETRKLSISACYVSEFCDGDKKDRIFAEGHPLPPEGDENAQVRNEEQGENQGDVMFYYESEHSRGMRKISDGVEDQQEMDEEDYKSESTTTEEEAEEEEGNDVALCLEQGDKNPQRDNLVKDGLEFISVQQWQDLIVEVGCEQAVEKINNFSEEEHQEAGESFAEYPSDFSLCDYVEDEEETQESSEQLTVMQDSSDEERVECLYGVDLGVLDVVSREGDKGKPKIVEKTSGDAGVLRCEMGDSHSSSHPKAQEVNSEEELYENPKDHKTIKQLEELLSGNSETFPRWSTYDDYNTDLADFDINWNPEVVAAKIFQSDDLLAQEDVYKEEITLSEDISTCSVTEDIRTRNSSKLGSLDDSFFFNADIETYGTSDLDQLGDEEYEEYEEERNWEQEQERIKAFYKFYDDSGKQDLKEGRQTKVQFCTEPLSQIIHYETDSSDRDSLSSSTDSEEKLNFAETSEDLMESDDSTEKKPTCDAPKTLQAKTVSTLSKTQNCGTKKSLNMLKLTLKMGVIIVMGLLMFWFATDQAGWLSQVSFL